MYVLVSVNATCDRVRHQPGNMSHNISATVFPATMFFLMLRKRHDILLQDNHSNLRHLTTRPLITNSQDTTTRQASQSAFGATRRSTLHLWGAGPEPRREIVGQAVFHLLHSRLDCHSCAPSALWRQLIQHWVQVPPNKQLRLHRPQSA